MTKLSLASVSPAPRPKSKAAQLSELRPEIEAALVAGHSHKIIFEHVKKTIGIDLTFGYYENTIHRIRQRCVAKTELVADPLPLPKLAMNGAQTINAPTSKLQQSLNAPIDDFFHKDIQ